MFLAQLRFEGFRRLIVKPRDGENNTIFKTIFINRIWERSKTKFWIKYKIELKCFTIMKVLKIENKKCRYVIFVFKKRSKILNEISGRHTTLIRFWINWRKIWLKCRRMCKTHFRFQSILESANNASIAKL